MKSYNQSHKMKLGVLYLIFPLIFGARCAKILGIFPHPSKSHHILGNALLKELAGRGHEVTMASPYELVEPGRNYHHVHLKGLLRKHEDAMRDMANNTRGIVGNILWMLGSMGGAGRGVLEDEGMRAFLASEPRFDVTILLTALNEVSLGIAHQVNSTPIGFSQIGTTPFTNNIMGNPSPIAYVPSIVLPFSDQMDFLQRTVNTLVTVAFELFMRLYYLPVQATVLREFFPEAPDLYTLLKNVDLTLTNSHFTTETPRPFLPGVIQIGGFHLEEKEHLDPELQVFMDATKRGVIYFSLGTNIKSRDLGENVLRELLAGFAQIEYDVLWKFEDDLPAKPANVKILKWLPQKAILRHQKTVAFITHGGLGSTVEAIYYGVPMICIPFFGDQLKNVGDSVAKGIAIHLHKNELNATTINKAIAEITTNTSYRNSIKLRSDLYRNQPVNPMERAVFWVEHVIKHNGAKHLRAKAVDLAWYQYMLLDVIAFIAFVICLLFACTCWFIKVLYTCCCRRNKPTQKSKRE